MFARLLWPQQCLLERKEGRKEVPIYTQQSCCQQWNCYRRLHWIWYPQSMSLMLPWCCRWSGLNSQPMSGVSVPCMFTISSSVTALCNSSWDLHRIGGLKAGTERMYQRQARALEYITGTHHVLCRICWVWRIDRLGSRKKKKTVWVVPAVIPQMMERFTPSIAIFQRQSGRLRKRLRDHTGPICSWLLANPCPASVELLCCPCTTTTSEETGRNMLR